MAVRLAASLIDHRGFDVSDIKSRYLGWWCDGAFDTGPVTGEVLRLACSGASFPQAADRVHAECGGMTAGCNPAHRSAPLAMLCRSKAGDLVEFARQDAALTHRHPLAGDVAAAVVSLCRYLIDGFPWSDALRLAAGNRLPETRRALRQSSGSAIGRGGYAPEVLAAAVHFVGASDSFDVAMRRSLEFAGPANYCPVLVGSVGGARWGAAAIPDAMTAHCEGIDHVRQLAQVLASPWPRAGDARRESGC